MVKWVHAYKLRGRSFWDIPLRSNMSWGWRKVLQIRPLIREFVWHNIGDGALTSLWYDRWCSSSQLANSISTRDMFRARLNPLSKVRNIFLNNVWTWPQELINKYPFLSSIVMPNHVDRPDLLEWRDEDGNVKSFSVSIVWRSIRPRSNKVMWVDVVWFSSCIPRHAFNLWLIVKQRLKTQDRVARWQDLLWFG